MKLLIACAIGCAVYFYATGNGENVLNSLKSSVGAPVKKAEDAKELLNKRNTSLTSDLDSIAGGASKPAGNLKSKVKSFIR